MALLNFKRPAGAKYIVKRRMVWGDGIAVVGQVIAVEDPADARGLCAAGKIAPLDDAARDHLRQPARWVEQPRNTSVHPKGAGVFSRENPWRPIQ